MEGNFKINDIIRYQDCFTNMSGIGCIKFIYASAEPFPYEVIVSDKSELVFKYDELTRMYYNDR